MESILRILQIANRPDIIKSTFDTLAAAVLDEGTDNGSVGGSVSVDKSDGRGPAPGPGGGGGGGGPPESETWRHTTRYYYYYYYYCIY
jgi:hypothetical protein